MSTVQKRLVLIIIGAACVVGVYVAYIGLFLRSDRIYFPKYEQSFAVEIADTEELRTQGLSGRASLPSGHGMWFAFEDEAQRTFWMKNMEFPLDIIWLNNEKEIIGIESQAQPPSEGVNDENLQRYVSPIDTQFVLEVNAGAAAAIGLEIGDRAVIK